jgi:hypothetical protein
MQFDGCRLSRRPIDGADIQRAPTHLFPTGWRATLRTSAAAPGMRQLTAESAYRAATLSLEGWHDETLSRPGEPASPTVQRPPACGS